MPAPWIIFLAWLLAMSAVTFAVYGIDKRRAIRSSRRISERTLLSLSLIGGAFGGLAAMSAFRHKTRHRYFWAINGAAAAVHVFILTAIANGGSL